MKRFSFATFIVDEGNRHAFQVCQDVADRKRADRLPVTLLGDSGCGKTHLLYSIVNRVRATSSKTGLAYVTAQDFPDRVRQLIDDPADVKRAESAVLLVDQLEQFGDLVEELEAVIRIFLDNNHYVVIASSVHPGRLQNLGPGLRGLLESGVLVPISQHTSEIRAELLRQQVRQESETVIAKQREEIQELKNLLEKVGRNGRVVDADETALLRKELEQERAAREAISTQLEVAKALAASVQHDLADARTEIGRLRNNADATRDPVFSQLQLEAASLRQQLADAQQQAEGLLARVEQGTEHQEALASARVELESLHDKLAALHEEAQSASEQLETERARIATIEAEKDDLKNQLAAALAESAKARKETADLLERAEKSLETIEANRARLLQAEQEQRRQVEELRVLLEQANTRTVSVDELETAKAQLLDAYAQAEALRSSAELDRSHFEQRLDRAHRELQHAIEEGSRLTLERDEFAKAIESARLREDELRVALEQAQSEAHGLRRTVESLEAKVAATAREINSANEQLVSARVEADTWRAELRRKESEMEALRQEAAGQVAAAHAHAGELEGRLGRLKQMFDAMRSESVHAESEVRQLEHHLVESVEALANIAARLAAVNADEFHTTHLQQDLFDALMEGAVEEPAFDEAPIESEQIDDAMIAQRVQASHNTEMRHNGHDAGGGETAGADWFDAQGALEHEPQSSAPSV